MNKKTLFLAAALACTAVFSFAKDFSDYEKEILSQVLDCRLKTRSFSTNQKAIDSVKAFHTKILAEDIQSKLSDEAKITFDNMLVLEIYNYMYADSPKSEELGPYIKSQYEKIQAYEDKIGEDAERNPWYVLSSGDLINSTMQFLPQSQAIKLGLKEKKDYDKVVSENDIGLGWINAALWYFFAPPIGGGSKDKAGKYFENAVNASKYDYEKFYANIYLSQYKFENGDKDSCGKYLSAADAVLPGNVYVPFIRRMNDVGYSVLYYSNNRDKVDAKMNKASK